MAYTLPQAQVFQEFTSVPTAIVDPLRAHVSGGNAQLFRYSESSEKLLIDLGAYDKDSDTEYSWPNRPSGGIVDQSYAKLWADDALLQYFHDAVGADSTIAPVVGKTDRVRSDSVNFKENVVGSTTYARDALLLDRDGAVGDVVDLRATVGPTTYTLRTTVKGFEGDAVAATVDATPDSDSGNAATQLASLSISQSAGPYNCVGATADAGSYDGTEDGDIDETYTVTVIQSSIGDDPTTAKLRVVSASGRDDVAEVTPADYGSPTTIGTRGLTVTFSLDSASSCSLSADGQGVSDNDLVEDQEWTISVEQAFVAPTTTGGGTYTGDTDTTYIVEVTRGGPFAGSDKPQISVTTVHGVDVSGPTDVTGLATAVSVGTKGATISFGGGATSLRKGDIYYIDVTAEFEGNMRTLLLNKNLPTGMEAAADMDLTLYIPKSDLEIPRKRTGAAPLVNYDLGDPGVNDTGFEVKSGITAFDADWTDGGVPQALPLVEATIYMEYRAWVQDKVGRVYALTADDDIDDIPGQLHPDNPLKWGVYMARLNANGTTVKYSGVSDPDELSNWTSVLTILKGEEGVYGLVPLTFDKSIHDAYASHVDEQSAAEIGRWRVMWAAVERDATEVVVDATTSSDGEEVLATVSDDPDVAGDQFVIVDVPAGNGDFVTNGVKSGDVLRFNYASDGWGDIVYDEFTIDAVINEDSLRLDTGQGTVEVTVAKKMEVHRNLDAEGLSEQLATKAGAYASKRVRAVWPDTASNAGTTFDGYHVAAALAGLRSGNAPNQGLTNVALNGIDEVDASLHLFNRDQLDDMAESGMWIVTQNEDGAIHSRHGLTTAGFGNVLTQEEMVIANVDSMSFGFLADIEEFIGRYNITPGTIDLVELRVEGRIEFFKEVRIERLGGQLIDGEVTSIRQHSILKDRLVVEVTLTVPVPLNNLDLHLTIVA